MGVGSSNVSTSDLSVYQSAITQISQNLQSSAQNASSTDLQASQTITFNNVSGPDILGCSTAGERVIICQTSCDANMVELAALNTPNAAAIYQDCLTACNNLQCTPAQIEAEAAQIYCNINLTNISGQSATTTQMAKSQVNAQMTVDLQNKFESEVDKVINQTNTDLNFMQFNTSDERTTVSQAIRNQISSAIADSSSNLQSTLENHVQNVPFNNSGIIYCQGCSNLSSPPSETVLPVTTIPSPNCAINITNSNLQNASINQTATAALTSILNAKVLNDLTSQYTLAVSQTNTGVNLLDLLLPIIILIIVFVLVVPITAWAFRPMFTEIARGVGIALAVSIPLGIIIFAVMYAEGEIPGLQPANSVSSNGVINTGGGTVLPETNNPAGYYLTNPGTGYTTGIAICTYDLTNHLLTSCPGYIPSAGSTSAPTSSPTSAPLASQSPHMLINITSINSTGGITGYKLNYGGTGYTVGQTVTVMGGNNDATFKINTISTGG